MDGYDPNNIPADLQNSINSGATSGISQQAAILSNLTFISQAKSYDSTTKLTIKSNKAASAVYGGSCDGDLKLFSRHKFNSPKFFKKVTECSISSKMNLVKG